MPATSGSIELRLLGRPRAWRDDSEFVLGSAHRNAVLCMLALHPGVAVTRDQLIAAIWGDQAPASAIGNVHTYISALRRLLEPDRDRWSAGRLLTSGGGTYRLNITADDVDVTRFETLRETARHHRLTNNVPAELATVETALAMWHGDALDGVPGPFAAAQRTRLTELRLATAERHAVLLAETGRPDNAVRALRTLSEENPERDSVQALLTGLLGGGRRATASTGPAVFGRDTEIQHLRLAVRGTGRSIRIEGPPGIGRSTVLSTALRGHVPPGHRLGWADGDRLSHRLPMGLLTECLEASGAVEPHAVPQSVDGVVELIGGLLATGPLTLVIDDIHLADPLTLWAWGRLAHLPLTLIATARTGAPVLPELPAGEVILLPPLDDTAAAALVRARSPLSPGTGELRRILAEANGHPGLLAGLAAETAGDRQSLPDAGAACTEAFPENTRRLLRAAGALGVSPQPAEVLAVALGNTPYEVREGLEPAVTAGLLRAGDERIAFVHPALGRALHESSPPALRIALHRRFAQRIAEAGGPPEVVAGQLLAGEFSNSTEAAGWLVRHIAGLAESNPDLAVAVLRRARLVRTLAPEHRLQFTAWLARLLLWRGADAAAEAGWVAARATDPDLAGEMRWTAAMSHERNGDVEAATAAARAALAEPLITDPWQHRVREMLDRLRPLTTGVPTHPHLPRSDVLDPGTGCG
ncbi:BTAD domain-containing putative transcriptional regulator [Actinoplanes couchii]|uniref:OmpR/PhoB-type domain-containing protein n=1 Tax=Actinoplanes couchii TaxID=403638 RepID=A0ABQ3XEC8_9ACTN|nr:BTAD domain-containing putative transcriptional regulator [Actinoplanes couchii]MDR6319737.1 DNA-binding SARP family transcriptional activator [Actinoplanes couchii]GID56871.1 hypothetical protein Aco03nite_052750 [Actinoplanes couchii]